MKNERLTRILEARARAKALYAPACHLCEVRCGAKRASGEIGECGLASETPVYRHLVHLGEELELVPSYAVWLAGCNFLCSFCSDHRALRPPLPGRTMPAEQLANRIAAGINKSKRAVRNINFVGGEPAISLAYLSDVAVALFDELDEVPPLLLNTNGYLTTGSWKVAIDLFDIFVVDYKFGNDECAARIASIQEYTPVLKRGINFAATASKEVWIRHLLMPGHFDCCTRPVIDWLAESKLNVRVNLMPSFVAFDKGWQNLSTKQSARSKAYFLESSIRRKYWDGHIMPT